MGRTYPIPVDGVLKTRFCLGRAPYATHCINRLLVARDVRVPLAAYHHHHARNDEHDRQHENVR